MADEAWLKHLASATLKGTFLAPEDPREVERLAASRIEAAIHELYEEAQEAAVVYNDHVRTGRTVAVLPATPDAKAGAGAAKPGEVGFMLLLGGAQISLIYRPHVLEATLVAMDGFRRVARPLHRFEPHVDPFGSVAWNMDNALLLTNELIMKRLFEDLRRAAP